MYRKDAWWLKSDPQSVKQALECEIRKERGSSAAAKALGMGTMTFWRLCKKYGLRKPRPGGRGTACMKPKKASLDDVLSGKFKGHVSYMKTWLYETNLKHEQCEICGQGNVWNGKRLVLQLDHIDGNSSNNVLKNLRIVCANCHTQTTTYGGKRNMIINTLSDEELKQRIIAVNETSASLYEAAATIGIAASHFRRLLIRFGL